MAKRIAKQQQEAQLGMGAPAPARGPAGARGLDENGRQELAALPARVSAHRAPAAAPPHATGRQPQQPQQQQGADAGGLAVCSLFLLFSPL